MQDRWQGERLFVFASQNERSNAVEPRRYPLVELLGSGRINIMFHHLLSVQLSDTVHGLIYRGYLLCDRHGL